MLWQLVRRLLSFVTVCCRISLVSFLQNKCKVHPTNICSMYSKIPYIRSNHRDVKCRSPCRKVPSHKNLKIL